MIWPAIPMALQDRGVFHSALPAQLCHSACRSIWAHNMSVVANVIHLLLRSGPAAIFRFVVAVCVFPVKAMFLTGRTAHIGKKAFVAVQPSFANCDPSAAVDRILLAIFSVAAFFHFPPSAVFLSGFVTLSMGTLRLAPVFISCASAACCIASLDSRTENQFLLTAIADAIPSQEATASRFFPLTNDSQSAEYFADQINLFHPLSVSLK